MIFNIVSVQKAKLISSRVYHDIYHTNIKIDNIEDLNISMYKIPDIVTNFIVNHIPEDVEKRICHHWKLIEASNKDVKEPIYILKTIRQGKNAVVITFTTKGVMIRSWGTIHIVPFFNENGEFEMELLGLRQSY